MTKFKKNINSSNYVVDGKIPVPKETKDENEVLMQKKKRWKRALIIGYFPLLAIMQTIFWIGENNKMIVFNDTILETIFSANFLLLAFSTNTRFNLVQLRDSKILTNFRKSHYWLIIEYSTFISVLNLSNCALLSFIELLTIKHSIVVFSILCSFFVLSLIYLSIAYHAGKHSNMYL